MGSHEKSYFRYIKSGNRPTWKTLRKWARGLHPRALEIQGRADYIDGYEVGTVQWYGGVRILEKLFIWGGESLRKDTLLAFFETYPRHFERQMEAVKKGTGIGARPRTGSAIAEDAAVTFWAGCCPGLHQKAYRFCWGRWVVPAEKFWPET